MHFTIQYRCSSSGGRCTFFCTKARICVRVCLHASFWAEVARLHENIYGSKSCWNFCTILYNIYNIHRVSLKWREVEIAIQFHYSWGIIQVSLCLPAPAVKNWTISLVQSFTAHMPLLTATSAFGLGRRRWSSNVLVAISKGMWAVKFCNNKILQFLTGGAG